MSKPKSDDRPVLGAALDQQSYNYLIGDPGTAHLIDAIGAELAGGATPQQLRYFAQTHNEGRPELAKRIEQAARHMLTIQANEGSI